MLKSIALRAVHITRTLQTPKWGEKHGNRVLRYYCPRAYVQRSRGWEEGSTQELCPPPPHPGAPRLWRMAAKHINRV